MPNMNQNENDEGAVGGDDNYFETFNEDFDLEPELEDDNLEEEEEVIGEEAPPTAVPAQSAAPAPAVEPLVTAPVTAPVETPAAQPEPVVQQPQVAPQVEPPKPFDMEAYVAEHLPRLEKLYTFSEEEAAQIQTEPELVMPKLAARLHMRIVQDALSGISAVLPQIIQQQQAAVEAERSSWDNFYSVNGDIRGKVTQDQILSVAGMYKQINPAATPEQVIREVGRIIRTSLGMADPQAAPAAVAPTNSPTPVQQPAPFVPARGSGLGSQVKSNNPWAHLAEELDEF